MAVFSLIGPTIFLLSGQSFNQFILTLALIVLAVISGLTAFIFIRICINWLQAKFEENRHLFRRAFKRKTGNSTANISEPEKVFLEPQFVESDGKLAAAILEPKPIFQNRLSRR
jgi:hypothetical protein